jgi:transcriptional regulator with XRE-family HTH domain
MSLQIFAKNLKYKMDQRGITRKQLADHMHVGESTVGAWLEARSYPRIPLLMDLCDTIDYHDIYALVNVDLRKQKKTEKQSLPVNVTIALSRIVDAANGVLKGSKVKPTEGFTGN